jgi:Phosphoribosyl-ATP pyrophosphohydrolase
MITTEQANSIALRSAHRFPERYMRTIVEGREVHDPSFVPHAWVLDAVKQASVGPFKPPLTPWQLVQEMSLAFGNPQGDPLNPNWEKVEAQRKGIREENEDELGAAIAKRDIEAARDALCDVMVFALGAYHAMGYDADRDMAAVVEALFTRFCRNKEHLGETVDHYTYKVGIRVYCGGEFPRMWVKSLEDQTGKDGAVYPRDKFLKARGYAQPVFYTVP